ncbi:MAG: RNA 2',3'-cyclic phosphodiesterase [Pyrobaculum sp.]|nr:RNA 2',3'-cyclic phosphodiesterase [Pyrobaculum sp.]
MSLVRSFVAVDIENFDVVRRIEVVQRELLRLGLEIKLVERENLHITLRFLGEIPQSRINDVVKAIAGIKMSRFQIKLRGIGVFPDLARPRVLWIGVSDGVEELKRLAAAVREAVDRFAESKEDREFVAHLTVGRIKSGRNVEKLQEFVTRYADVDFGVVTVDKIKLKKSVLTPRGPIYTDLFVQPLT